MTATKSKLHIVLLLFELPLLFCSLLFFLGLFTPFLRLVVSPFYPICWMFWLTLRSTLTSWCISLWDSLLGLTFVVIIELSLCAYKNITAVNFFLLTQGSTYALSMTPVALSLEELLPQRPDSLEYRSASILIRTSLVISTLAVAILVPFFGNSHSLPALPLSSLLHPILVRGLWHTRKTPFKQCVNALFSLWAPRCLHGSLQVGYRHLTCWAIIHTCSCLFRSLGFLSASPEIDFF